MKKNSISKNKLGLYYISNHLFLSLCLLLVLFIPSYSVFALPSQFQDQLVKSGLDRPTSMAFLPDGKMLITQKHGQIWILDPSLTSPVLQSYLNITDLDTFGERGLLDIVLDPGFPAKPYIYVSYHRISDRRIFISRFTHQSNTNTANLTSEFIVWKDPDLASHPFHHGGGLSFGPDGHIYLTTGEQFVGFNAQNLTRAGGKIIRVASNGTIPADNPFVDGPGGNLDEIWAYGLRNPWRSRWDLGSTVPRLFIGEVGGNLGSSNEDVHIGRKGANYGWPYCSGNDCNNSNEPYDAPLFTYEHLGKGASIIGGIVYHGSQFPPFYSGAYFYGDFARPGGFIRYLILDDNGDFISDESFLENAGAVVDIKEGPDGALYYLQYQFNANLTRNTGTLKRISYDDGNQAPQITSATANITSGELPLNIQFSGSAIDAENDSLEYLWIFGDGQQAVGANTSHTYSEIGSYQARLQVSDDDKTTTSNPPINIVVGSAPEVTLQEPIDGSIFRAGDTIDFSAFASDDGVLTENNYSWLVQFVHNEHTHPVLGPISGSSGTLDTPNSGHSFFDDTGFQISVEVTDEDGISTNKSVRIYPEKVDITFDSQPNGISFFIDDTIITTPIIYDTAIGFKHDITAPQASCLNETLYGFDGWSNGEAASHTYTVPDLNDTLTATYTSIGFCDANNNAVPLAFSDTVTVVKNTSQLISVLDNDIDSDGELIKDTVTIISNPQHGNVSVNTNTGVVTYSHDGSPATNDTFTYTVEDEMGAVSNEATVSIALITGSCGKDIELDGINDLVNIPDLTLANDFTLESWVKLAPGIDYKDGIFGNGSNVHLYFVAGKPRLYAYGVRVTANTEISEDTWAHIALTRSGTILTMYVNGVEDGTGNWNGSLNIKSLGQGYRGYFKGIMDEVRIWNIARSGSEINANYTKSVIPSTAGLIGYWTLNETGQTVIDASSFGNHGSLGSTAAAGTDDPVRATTTSLITESCNAGGGGDDGGDTGGDQNVAPVANNDTVGSVQAGDTLTFTVTGNDTDSDGNMDSSSVTIVSGPNDGNASVNASGTITYNNTGSTATTDIITYTVEDSLGAVSNVATVTITVTTQATVNEPPIAQDDTVAPMQPSATTIINVLENDTDDSGLALNTVTIVTEPSHGNVDVNLVTGEITYTHDGSIETNDNFTYTVEDQDGEVSNQATVSITLLTSTSSCGKDIKLDGINDWVNIPNLTLTADFTIEAWVKLDAGIDNKDALFGQEGGGPDINFFGGKVRLYAYGDRVIANTAILPDTWTHIAITRSGTSLTVYMNGIQDGTGSWNGGLSLKAIGRGNRGFLKGSIDEVRVWNVARSGSEINAGYTKSVTPSAAGLIGYWTLNGADQTVIDASSLGNHGSLGSTAAAGTDDPVRATTTSPITESCNGGGDDGGDTGGDQNVAPVANNDTVGSVQAGDTLTFTVTGNDTDSDGNMDSSSVTIVSGPNDGNASVNASGTITYNNTGSTATTDIITYTVEDSLGAVSNVATVTITVTTQATVNEPPIAQDDTVAPIQPSATTIINVLENDTDDSGLALNTVTIVTEPSHGNVDVNLVTGEITYTHDGSIEANDNFNYTVEDQDGVVSNQATVSITLLTSTSSCGKDIKLDGINDWVNIPNLTLTADFTIEAWVKLDAGIDNKDALFGQEGGGPDINFYAGKARLYAYGDRVIANTAILPNTWTHIAITRSGTNLTVYINGFEDGTGSWNGGLSLKAIGRGNRGFLKGSIDEVRIWNIARSGSEVSTNYDQNVAPNTAGLIGYWALNGADQTAVDASNFSNHGSLGSTVLTGSDDPQRTTSTAPIIENCN